MGNDGVDDKCLKSQEARKIIGVTACQLSHLRTGGKIAFRKEGNAYLYSTRDARKLAGKK